jgi:GNAT superfamily N-acetyltransferase
MAPRRLLRRRPVSFRIPLVSSERVADAFKFVVEFSWQDGALFVRGPCCGADAGGTIVGIRQVKIHAQGTREVGSGVVLPAYRRQGISARLMAALFEHAHGPLYLMCNAKWAPYSSSSAFRK